MNRHTQARAAFIAQTRHRIRIVMATEAVTSRQLAKKAKITYGILMNTMNAKTAPKLGNFARISEALGFDLDALLGRKSLFAGKVRKLVIACA